MYVFELLNKNYWHVFLNYYSSILQTNRLVLQAKALETVGLRTITARHLALCAQSLGAVLALLPFLQARFRDLLTDRMQVRHKLLSVFLCA